MNPKTVEIAKAMDEFFTGPEKWVKGRFGECDTCQCFVGCLIDSFSTCGLSGFDKRELRREVYGDFQYMAFGRRDPDLSLLAWNDEPGRTFSDIKDLLARVISS